MNNMYQETRPIEILLVEDSPGDVVLTQEGFSRARIKNTLHVVSDGVEAMEFLRQQGTYANAPTPDLILLDLNMPRMDGREVLEEIKKDPELTCIPVVVLTTSDAEADVLRCYGLHANSYITKPVEFPKFMNVVQSIESFWLTVVTLPKSALAAT